MLKTVGIDKDITITDEVRFVLQTTDGNDCPVRPYQITKATLYFISREFTDTTASEYTLETQKGDLLAEYEALKAEACLKSLDSVRVATDSDIDLLDVQTVDGIALAEGDRVLVRKQTDKTQNGIYVVSSGPWSRSGDADTSEKFVAGMYVFVDEGLANVNSGWYLSKSGKTVLGTSPILFLNFPASDPSPDMNLIQRLAALKVQLDESKTSSPFFYKEAIPVKIFGGVTDPGTQEFFPAWLNPDMVPSEIRDNVIADNILSEYEENGQTVKGKFVLEWNPLGCREGDYFICWSWMPNLAGDVLSAHMFFSLEGDSHLNTSIPTHYTQKDKYETLMSKYLPEMFKTSISDSDLTREVLQELNGAVAKGFTFLENLANQTIDLLDANATHEQLLPLLSNMFDIKLKSNDPTLWRRQIKKAMPNFKRKGSVVGLKSALSDIGMKFLKLTRLWQVVSKYTYQEHFDYSGENSFPLSKTMVLPIDENFGFWLRSFGGEWVDLTDDYESYVDFVDGSMVWIGDDLSDGDSVRILYKVEDVPSGEQSKEDYIRTMLPLMDDRDERMQQYPPKNWNVRLLEEDDPLFDLIVPVRHPLSDPIVWGRIRTEFPYSENAYNMDEYNGSKRDSMNPCDIDKEFLDGCGSCQSSKFALDLEVERLSDDSLSEAGQIIKDYMPFHALAHSLNLSGAVNEFIKSSEETIEVLVTYSAEDVVLAGEAQHIFNRSVDKSQIDEVKRDILASFSAVEGDGNTTWTGLLKNQRVSLQPSFSSDDVDLTNADFRGMSRGFNSINVNTSDIQEDPFDSSNLLEVLGATTRNFSLSTFGPGSAEVNGSVDGSLIGPLFEYRVSNKIADMNVDIIQADQTVFSDENFDFSILGIVTQYDVDKNSVAEDVWTIRTGGVEYLISNLLPDGTLVIEEIVGSSSSSSSSSPGWDLTDGTTVVKHSDSDGVKTVYKYGMVESNSGGDPRDIVSIGDYLYMNWPSSTAMYRIRHFASGDQKFYIEGYDEGGMAGESVKVYRRVLEGKVGAFGYEGLELEADLNVETELSISNGANYDAQNIRSDNVKENFLIFIDSDYYTISEIDGSALILAGPMGDYTTDGQGVNFMIYKFAKESLDLNRRVIPAVPAYRFDAVGRSGEAVIKHSQRPGVSFLSTVLNSANSGSPVDIMEQNENIEFKIEYKDETR